jgi:hypothetical protein
MFKRIFSRFRRFLVGKTYNAYSLPALKGLMPEMQQILAKHNLALLQSFDLIVLPAAEMAVTESQKRQQLETNLQPQILACSSERTGIEQQLATYQVSEPVHDLPEHLDRIQANISSRLELLMNLALGFMLALGIAHYLNLELKKIESFGQFIMLLLSIGIGWGVTIAIKLGIKLMAVSTRSLEAEQTFPFKIPFWVRLEHGDPLVYILLLFPFLEALFTSPALLQLLQPDMAENPLWIVSTYIGACLTGAANVFIAFSLGLDEIRREQRRQQQEREWRDREEGYATATNLRDADPNYKVYYQRLGQLNTTIDLLEDRLKIQRKIAADQYELAKQEFQQWKRIFDSWCDRNRYLIQSESNK